MTRLNWRIADTEANLAKGWFVAWGIPAPDTSNYRGHSTRQPKTNGGIALHGYKTVTLRWNVLDPQQSRLLRLRIQAGLNNTGLVYMTIDRFNAEHGDRDWIDVSGYPHMPEFTSSAAVAGSTGRVHDGIEFVLNNVTIINDPALL